MHRLLRKVYFSRIPSLQSLENGRQLFAKCTTSSQYTKTLCRNLASSSGQGDETEQNHIENSRYNSSGSDSYNSSPVVKESSNQDYLNKDKDFSPSHDKHSSGALENLRKAFIQKQFGDHDSLEDDDFQGRVPGGWESDPNLAQRRQPFHDDEFSLSERDSRRQEMFPKRGFKQRGAFHNADFDYEERGFRRRNLPMERGFDRRFQEDDFGRRPAFRNRGFDARNDRNFDYYRGSSFDSKFNSRDSFSKRSRRSDDWNSRLEDRHWDASKLDSFEKNFYVSHPSLSARLQEDVDEFYKKHDIEISDGEKPIPLQHYEEANFPDQINQCLVKMGFIEPTPIQSIGWPIGMSGKNLVGVAQTGSGKTLGFLLPAFVHIRHQRPVEAGGGPIVLVMAPTRELVQQIHGVANVFSRRLGLRSSCAFGGQSKERQARNLYRGQELLVATPGRLIDFCEEGVINLDRTTFVVLDEADRMLDMGFEPQIRRVLSQIRPDKQIMMWTATWPKEIRQLASDYLGDFIQVNIGSEELTINPNIKQIFKVCEQRQKFRSFLKEFTSHLEAQKNGKQDKTLIFVNTKRGAEYLSQNLYYNGIDAREIHGDKSQSYRDTVLEDFRIGRLNVLVATEVAARGLDVEDIGLVVNYDLPTNIDSYIHRIGRTARASKSGTALSMCTAETAQIVPDLMKILKRADQEIDPVLHELMSSTRRHQGHSMRRPPPRFSSHRSYDRGGHRGNRWD